MGDLIDLFVREPLVFAGTAFVVGLAVGSFLNVVIYRLPIILERTWAAHAREVLSQPASEVSTSAPAKFTLSVPRSACPHCKAPIRAWQNIPVISYLALGGKCAACRTKISPRYPLIELLTGVTTAWVAWHFGFGTAAICAMVITWFLIAMSGIDIDHQLLPDGLTLPLMWGGLLTSAVIGHVADAPLPVSPSESIVGAAAGYLSLWLVFHAFRLVTGKEGMGYGDFKLFAAWGAWLGWTLLPLIIMLSAASGAILGIAMIMLRGRDRAAPMPFGPYLAIAGWIAMMYGDALVTSYVRISGLHR